MFHRPSKHLEFRQKYSAARRIFNSLPGVWKCGKTRSFVLDGIYFNFSISNTRDSVSSGYPNTEKRVENTTRSEIRGVWIADETLARVFDISSQLKQ